MRSKNSLLVLFMVYLFFGCTGGSGGGGTSTDTGTGTSGTGSTGGTSITGGTGNSGNQASGSTSTTTSLAHSEGDLETTRISNGYRVNIRGINTNLTVDEDVHGFHIFDTYEESRSWHQAYGWDYYGSAFEGDWVDGEAVAWFRNGDITSNSDYHLAGTLTDPAAMPSSSYVYMGAMSTVRPWDDINSGRVVTTEVQWIADFDAGSLVGYDYPHQAVIEFEGDITGNDFEGFVTYQLGRDQFTGSFYGPDAAELAGALQNGGVTVIFYGDFNPYLTQQLP